MEIPPYDRNILTKLAPNIRSTKLYQYLQKELSTADDDRLIFAIYRGISVYLQYDLPKRRLLEAQLMATLEFGRCFYSDDQYYLSYQNGHVAVTGQIKFGSLLVRQMDEFQVYRDLFKTADQIGRDMLRKMCSYRVEEVNPTDLSLL